MSLTKEIYRLEYFFQITLSVVNEASFDFKIQGSWKNDIFIESVWDIMKSNDIVTSPRLVRPFRMLGLRVKKWTTRNEQNIFVDWLSCIDRLWKTNVWYSSVVGFWKLKLTIPISLLSPAMIMVFFWNTKSVIFLALTLICTLVHRNSSNVKCSLDVKVEIAD